MSRANVPIVWRDGPGHRRQLGQAINDLLDGAHNEIHDVTMANGATTTRYPSGTDTLERITPSTVAVLVPVHQEAADLMIDAAGPPWPTMNVGYITFTHGNTANTNQDFKLLLFGD